MDDSVDSNSTSSSDLENCVIGQRLPLLKPSGPLTSASFSGSIQYPSTPGPAPEPNLFKTPVRNFKFNLEF